ncbi:MAG: carbohydrate-binding protein, partial [Phycisphaerales bacterium]|nr:carbohydrate-binding protein [Phycisphaerales bacterium]
EWLEYTVDAAAGEYLFDARVASESQGGSFRLRVDGVDVGETSLDATGGWQNWTTVSGSFEVPTSGTHVIRFERTGGEFNLNRFDFTFIPPFEGDANGDGMVDFLDLNLILSFWGTSDPRADLDGNGLVDFNDLNTVLAHWGQVDN